MIRLLILLLVSCQVDAELESRCTGKSSDECCASAGDSDCADALLPVTLDAGDTCQQHYCEAYTEAGCPVIHAPGWSC